MAKDARGHGSDAKGGGAFYQPTKTIPAQPGGQSESAAHQIAVQEVGQGYFARASASGGRKLGEYGPHPDRETAAAQAWQNHPNAKQVSTARGQFGMDVRWHDKGK